MGVPKFYRWLSERYPLITQRHGVRPTPELANEHLGRSPPEVLPHPDPLSTCGLPPPIDRLYIDMNGIIHGCSHNNDESNDADEPNENAVANITEPEIFQNISYYLDRLVKEVARPRELIYIAIDGVAPRAKLNQQRARRYRSAQEGEIERTVYDAHKQALEEQQQAKDRDNMAESSYDSLSAEISVDGHEGGGASGLREVEPGRFAGKFETTQETGDMEVLEGEDSELFHSNYITPGTPFFQRCTAYLEDFLRDKMDNDPDWKHLQIIFSGPNTPGEGEHKIMQFLREQKTRPDYDPNLRHCIMGQDGDLIMLGLVSHEPNLFLLREQVLFDKKRRQLEPLAKKYGLDMYLFASTFEFLHMNLLRDYIALELETSNVVESSPFDIERTVDDFVFLTFFVGNDFLPHMPALDIGDEALDLLIYTYRVARKQWQKQYEKDPTNTPEPYLTYSGEIVSGKRLEHFLYHIGRHESNFYAYKEKTTDYDLIRKTEEKYGDTITPSDEVLQAKENADRNKYRELIQRAVNQSVDAGSNLSSSAKFTPVMASKLTRTDDMSEVGEDDEEEGVLGRRMGEILENSIIDDNELADNHEKTGVGSLVIDETDFKGRYYADKFGFSPYDAEKHLSLRKAYVEGLVWNLRYYYQCHRTTLSWEWFYPYHYGPMISDLIDLDTFLSEISFENRKGAPLKPFEQLLACLPASQSKLLPLPYQGLMTDKDSPIIEFFPQSFTVDMNGKRWPWEAVVLLPFIDSTKLRECSANIDTSELTEQELLRNEFYDAQVIFHEESKGKSLSVPLGESSYALKDKKAEPRFRPVVDERTIIPLDGLPTLRDGTVQSMARKRIRVNVHGAKSRYQTALLEIANEIPELVPLETLSGLIGSTIYINYPALIESFVTAVSNSTMCYRGKDPPILWDGYQATSRKDRVKRIVNAYTRGHGLTGTGGLILPASDDQMTDRETLLYVRPLKELKTLSDGTVVKSFANYELEVPLFVLSWAPVNEDSRSKGIPLQLEKDPYHCAKRVLTDVSSTASRNVQQLPSRGSLSSTQVGMFMKGYMQKRGLSALSTNPIRRDSGFSMKPEFATSRRFEAITSARKVALPRGRMLAVGLVWAAVIAGINAVQAVAYPNILQKSRNMDVDMPSLALENSFGAAEDYPMRSRTTAPLQFLHGTTTVSFKYNGGIVAAVDSRASLGDYIGSKTTQKVLPIHPSALGTMAGGAADCTFWIRRLAAEAALYSVENDGKLMSIARASRLLANALYENRAAGLSIGTMIMGFDSDPGSLPRIFYVDNSGRRLEGDMFAVGSGSTYAQGILDTELRYDMTDEEAVALGLKAIRHATFRDAGSGGFINVYLIKRDGWRHVFRLDIAATHETMEEEVK